MPKVVILIKYVSNKYNVFQLCGGIGLPIMEKYKLKNIINNQYGLLKYNDNENLESLKSGIKYNWICNCGKTKSIKASHVINGATKSCGCLSTAKTFVAGKKQPNILVSKLHNENFKIISLNTDKDRIGSTHLIDILCKCGNKLQVQARMFNKQKGCNNCNVKNEKFWSQKFNKLKILDDYIKPYKKHSHQKVKCLCECGNITEVEIQALTRKDKPTLSCGNCSSKYKEWWDTKDTSELDNELSVDKIDKFFNGPIKFIRPIGKLIKTGKYEFICPGCKNKFIPYSLSDMIYQKIVSCGCLTSRVSSGHKEIYEFLKNNNYNPENEYSINGKQFDIKVNNILIEYDGLLYHSNKFNSDHLSQRKKKLLLANKHGFQLLSIYEDEWMKKKNIIKNLLLNKLGNKKVTRLRPKKCEIKLIESKYANDFYEKYHYIGKTLNKYNIAMIYENNIIACMGIKSPSRQNSGDWEISRMVSKNGYRIHGCWSYILKWVTLNLSISGKLVTFSDNRLFNGNVYSKMGFKHVKDIRPDYYWVKGKNRYHKSSLRKTKEEKLTGLTETELRESQGYYKIYDVGKKKWEMII